jgi:hypothetical protein
MQDAGCRMPDAGCRMQVGIPQVGSVPEFDIYIRHSASVWGLSPGIVTGDYPLP